jgi:hypothetical protein
MAERAPTSKTSVARTVTDIEPRSYLTASVCLRLVMATTNMPPGALALGGKGLGHLFPKPSNYRCDLGQSLSAAVHRQKIERVAKALWTAKPFSPMR